MANWSDAIRTRPASALPREREPRPSPRLPAWLADWESLLTLALVLMVFLSVARSIDRANWVPGIPSLVNLSLVAIIAGALLARVRAPEIVLHLVALVLGAAIVYWLMVQFVDAPSFREGVHQFRARWAAWITVLRSGAPSNDNLPFVTLMLGLCWIAAYLSAWSIFRWRNAWIALIPGGIALLTNISYLPSQFSGEFVIFLFGAMLLVMRVHMMKRVREWRATGTQYPAFLSLRLLNTTTWVALAALIVAWVMPQANEVGLFSRSWQRISSPFTGDSDQFVRLFSGIDAKHEVPLHNFGETLPLQGRVVLGSRIAAQVEFGDSSTVGRPIRVKVYDEYTAGGWKAGTRVETEVAPIDDAQAAAPAQGKAAYRDRSPITTTFVVESGFPKNALPTVGQPVGANVPARADVIGSDPVADWDSLRSRRSFKLGDQFSTTGTVSTASEEKLRGAPAQYPAYISERYVQLPANLPARVRQLATDLTRDRQNPYDKAKAIESYLRTFTPTYDIRPVPVGRDAVDFFLFDEKKGYSDYQATAMVVMLRAAGVPARLAVGYTTDEYDLSVQRFLLRDKNAYAWPEVYFPGYGWQEFAPYGDAPTIARPAADTAAADTAASDVPDLQDAPPLDFGDITDQGGASPTPIVTAKDNPLKVLLPVLYVLMALLALAAVAGIGLRVAWERGMAGLDLPAQLWEKTVRLASWMRMGPRPHETPTEYGRSLTARLPEAAKGVNTVARDYQISRYGRRELTEQEQQDLSRTWTPLRNRMIKRLLRLK